MTLDIEDAFTQEAIAAAGVDVDDNDEAVVRDVIRRVAQVHEVELNSDEESLAVLCFVAGRAYQEGNSVISVEMTRQELVEYSRYLVARRGTS